MYNSITKPTDTDWDKYYNQEPIIEYIGKKESNDYIYKRKWFCPYCGSRDIEKETEVCFGIPGYIEKCTCNECGARF